MTALSIQLLGGFKVLDDSAPPIHIHQPRLQSLLAYLLLNRHTPQARHHLAFLFWPDASESQARNNLRQALYRLRQSLLPSGDHFFINANMVQWQPEAAFQLDVAEFEAAVARSEALERSDVRAYCEACQEVVARYRGDLLPSCYDEWIGPERERLRQLYRRSLENLVQGHESQREYSLAVGYARSLFSQDLTNEEACLKLMRLHALNADRASALQAYRECLAALQHELNLEPGGALRSAYEQLLHQDTRENLQLHQPGITQPTTPLIGRQAEWTWLQGMWRRVMYGHALLALITGEAGIGKTRLAEELVGWATRQAITAVQTRAYEAEGQLSYSPIVNWLRNPTIFNNLSRLDPLWLSEISRLLPELLIQNPSLPSPRPLAEYEQRQRFFEALARGVLAVKRPLLLQMDDLQWCDPETLEWLRYLLRFDSTAPLLIVGTVRSGELHANESLTTLVRILASTGQASEIALEPLDAIEISRLAGNLLGRELSPVEAAQLFDETEGNPFFLVEMISAQTIDQPYPPGSRESLIHFDPRPPGTRGSRSLPPKVYAVVSGRLARLSKPATEIIGAAATIGRDFTTQILAAVVGEPDDTLVDALDELWQRRIIREQAAGVYDFSHDKLREVAYLELSPAQRQRLHLGVAQALESIYAQELDPLSAQLAAHYEQAGLSRQALPYYLQAAEVSQRVFAHEEAIVLLKKGLVLLQKIAESSYRLENELAFYIALGSSQVSLRGYGAPEVMEAFGRAHEIGERLGKPPSPPVLRALVIAHLSHTQFDQAYDLATELLQVAQDEQDTILQVEGHYVVGAVLHYRGEWQQSRVHLGEAIAHYDPRFASVHNSLFAQDPKVVCLIRLALDLWGLGYPELSAEKEREGFALAQSLGHPFSLGYYLDWDALLRSIRGDSATTQLRAEAAIDLSREYHLGQWEPMGLIFHGWAIGDQGDLQAGFDELQAGIKAMQATGFQALYAFFTALLSGLHAKIDHLTESLSLLDQALDFAISNDERWYEAELYRQRGVILLRQGDEAEAEKSWLQAQKIAQAQQVKSFELRAAVALARLWFEQGHTDKARACLEPVYHWFREGFDTPDLTAARQLLGRLEQ